MRIRDWSSDVCSSDLHGVISFYHDFRKEPPGRHVVKICRAEACQSVGGRDSEARAKERLNADFHETSADGRYTLDRSEERRVGKAWVRTCIYRWSPDHLTKKKKEIHQLKIRNK